MINFVFLAITFELETLESQIKGSKDPDISLVSIKDFSKILPCSGSTQGQVTWAEMAKNLPHLWRHPQKTQNQRNYFQLRTGRLTEPFGGLNSSLAQLTGELWSCKTWPWPIIPFKAKLSWLQRWQSCLCFTFIVPYFSDHNAYLKSSQKSKVCLIMWCA